MKKLVLILFPALVCGPVFIDCTKQEVTVTVELSDKSNVNHKSSR